MTQKYRKIFVFISIISLALSLSVDSNDLLSGQGLFNTQTLGSFTPDAHHTTSWLVVNSSNVLKIQKADSQQVSYHTGLQYSFTHSQPQHISFQFSSVSPDTQDANLRLMDHTTQKTILLFRAGKAGFIRVNENQMISFYNSSVSTDSNVKTIKMDILLNWGSQNVQIFVNGQYKGSANFFQSVSQVDKLRIYNLYPSVSYWKNIVVCQHICYSFNNDKNLIPSLLGILLLVALIIFN